MTLRCGRPTDGGKGPPCQNRVRGDWPCATHGGPNRNEAEIRVREEQRQGRVQRRKKTETQLREAEHKNSPNYQQYLRRELESKLREVREQNSDLQDRLRKNERKIGAHQATISSNSIKIAHLEQRLREHESSKQLARSIQRRTTGNLQRSLLRMKRGLHTVERMLNPDRIKILIQAGEFLSATIKWFS